MCGCNKNKNRQITYTQVNNKTVRNIAPQNQSQPKDEQGLTSERRQIERTRRESIRRASGK